MVTLAAMLILLLAVVVGVSCGGGQSPKPSGSVGAASSTPDGSPGSTPSFAPGERLVATYFYYWYDLPDGPHSTLLTDHPAEPDASYQDVGWFKKQLADMSYAGIDIALPAYWWVLEPSSDIGLANMSQAYDQLASEGQAPPNIGMFLDTGVLGNFPLPERDLTVPLNQERVYQMIYSFFQIVPEHQRASIHGRPIVWLWSAWFDIKYDRSFFDYVMAQFELDFGVRPYLVGEESWRFPRTSDGVFHYDEVMPLDAFYLWSAAATGFKQPPGGIAEVGPGYDERTLPGRPGTYQGREDGQFYVENFEKAIDFGSNIIAIETWNEFHEASDVADSVEYGRQYIELTRQLVNLFKGIEDEPSPVPSPTASPGLSPPPAPTASTPSPVVSPGDVDCDGDVDAVDVILVLRGPVFSTGEPFTCAEGAIGGGGQLLGDVDCDGAVRSTDALLILRSLADSQWAIDALCAATA
jgi:hypothetical protein